MRKCMEPTLVGKAIQSVDGFSESIDTVAAAGDPEGTKPQYVGKLQQAYRPDISSFRGFATKGERRGDQ